MEAKSCFLCAEYKKRMYVCIPVPIFFITVLCCYERGLFQKFPSCACLRQLFFVEQLCMHAWVASGRKQHSYSMSELNMHGQGSSLLSLGLSFVNPERSPQSHKQPEMCENASNVNLKTDPAAHDQLQIDWQLQVSLSYEKTLFFVV